MSALGNYSSEIPKDVDDGSEKDLRAEMGNISKKDTAAITQVDADDKLADPAFFGYVQGSAEGVNGSSGTIEDFLSKNDSEQIMQMWEKYNTTIKPVMDGMDTFVKQEFMGNFKVLTGAEKTNAEESISSYLGRKAGADPDGFVNKYQPLLEKHKEQKEKIAAAEARMTANYGTADTKNITKMVGQAALEAQRGIVQQAKNTTEHGEKRGEIKNQWFNTLRRVKNFLKRKGFQSDAEIEEDRAYNESQNPLTLKVDQLRGLTENATRDIAAKADLDNQIGSTRGELIKVLEDSAEIRKSMEDAIKAAMAKKTWDVDDAASSLDAMGEVWQDGDPAAVNDMMKIVYEKEVSDSAEAGADAKAVDKGKMAQFDSFLARNMKSPQALEMMKKVTGDKYDALKGDKNPVKRAQIARMKAKIEALAA